MKVVATQAPHSDMKPFHSVVSGAPDVRVVPSASDKIGEPKIGAGKFKATCLQLLDRAAEGESIAITKHGKVVARLVPPESVEERPFRPLLGRMKGKGRILGDIVSPDFEAWGEEDPSARK